MKAKRRAYWWWLVGVVTLVGVLVAMVINRQWLYDFWRGTSYEATGEMSAIEASLQLTERGEFLFKASWPKLSLAEEFNAKCRTKETKMAVLGCYAGGDIYIYNINVAELEGIRELTTAHELLHAVWARMSEAEQGDLAVVLEQVYDDSKEILKDELAVYDASERQEELFVRAGTELKNLPAGLEKIYGEIFADRDVIVDFYNNYIGVFREIEQEMAEILAEMEEVQAEIEMKSVEYKRRAEQLSADVVNFNSCVEVAKCFKDEEDFDMQRARLIAEQDSLGELYSSIDELVDRYNVLVEQYNADVTRTEKLNRAINSNNTLEGI